MDFFDYLVIAALVVTAIVAVINAYIYVAYPHGPNQLLANVRRKLKQLRGIREVKTEWACPNGYLCTMVTYSDGDQLYFR